MVACKVLVVGVAKLVAGSDDQRRAELERAPAGIALAVAGDGRSNSGDDLAGREQLESRRRLGAGDLGGGPVLIEKDREGNSLGFDEGLGISFASGADRSDFRPGGPYLVVSIADLTGPLTAGQSAKVAEEEDHLWLVCPQVAQPHRILIRVDHHGFGQGRDIEAHGERVPRIEWFPEGAASSQGVRRVAVGTGCRGC